MPTKPSFQPSRLVNPLERKLAGFTEVRDLKDVFYPSCRLPLSPGRNCRTTVKLLFARAAMPADFQLESMTKLGNKLLAA